MHMKTNQRLQLARKAAGFKSAADASERLGIPYGTYSAHENGSRGIKEAELLRYAKAYNASVEWLLTGDGDSPKGAQAILRPTSEISQPMPAPEFSQKRLPVFGMAVGGDDGRFEFNGQMLDTVACPPGLENVPNAYAVWVSGESMVPRFKPGETVWVHPARPARREDDVVIQLHPANEEDPPEGYIKEFVAWTPTRLIVRQHNPPKEIEFERSEVKDVHVIIGSLKT